MKPDLQSNHRFAAARVSGSDLALYRSTLQPRVLDILHPIFCMLAAADSSHVADVRDLIQ